MKRNPGLDKADPRAAEPDDLDAILASEADLVPSSGFLAAVMERVEGEAIAPPPIPFPWKRMLPGMVIAAAVLGWALVEFLRSILASEADSSATVIVLPHLALPLQRQAGWIAAALLVSLASWFLSRRLAGRSGLL